MNKTTSDSVKYSAAIFLKDGMIKNDRWGDYLEYVVREDLTKDMPFKLRPD